MSGSDKVTGFSPHDVREKRRTHGLSVIVALAFGISSLLSACSGIKTYDNSLKKNLYVRTATDSGSWFSRVRIAVDINRVGEKCAVEYEGTVQLTEPSIEIGIPSDRWSHLVFVFASFSFWANRSGTITYETLLKPRPYYHYDAAVSYRDEMYSVAIREVAPNRSTGRELDPIPLSACGSSSTRK